MADDYVALELTILRVNKNSIIVEGPDGQDVVIGRSCIFGPDETVLDNIAPETLPELRGIRIMRWLARKEDLI